jgi:hypothetical protein
MGRHGRPGDVVITPSEAADAQLIRRMRPWTETRPHRPEQKVHHMSTALTWWTFCSNINVLLTFREH